MPDWYRTMVGKEDKQPEAKWRTNPEDPRYVQHFGGMIRALGARYDGHPLLESVDLPSSAPGAKGPARSS